MMIKNTVILGIFLFCMSLSAAEKLEASGGCPPGEPCMGPLNGNKATVAEISNNIVKKELLDNFLGKCLMDDSSYKDYEKEWQRYRLAVKTRFNLLSKMQFRGRLTKHDKLPERRKLDRAFQSASLDKNLWFGKSPEEQMEGLETELEKAGSDEKPPIKLEEVRSILDLKPGTDLQTQFNVLNNYIYPPYGQQTDYDHLFREKWNENWEKKKKSSLQFSDKNGRIRTLTEDDVRSIDAIARTMTGEVGSCKDPQNGHFQMVGLELMDRADASSNGHPWFARKGPYVEGMSQIEKVISKLGQQSNWNTGTYGPVNVQGVTLKKMIYPSKNLKRTLCPDGEAGGEEKIKNAMEIAMDMYLDPEAFRNEWQWPNPPGKVFYYTHGMVRKDMKELNVKGLIHKTENGETLVNLKLAENRCPSARMCGVCPEPHFYEEK